MKLLDKSPFIILPKPGKVSVKCATNQKDGQNIYNKEEGSMKVKVDFFGKNCYSTGDNPEEGEAVSMVPEKVGAGDKWSDGLHRILFCD